jgi:hypothetical protein
MENLYTIGKLFSERIFRVPDYQRGYAWEQQQCQDFVEDLELLSEGQEHFFGLVILHARSDGSGTVVDQKGRAYDVYDVVDGQQRLTTVVLFLDAIRREMEQFEALQTLASGLRETFIATRDMNGVARPKLRLNRDTHEFFYNAVLRQGEHIGGPKIRSHELLAQASAQFETYFNEKRQGLAGGYTDWLKAQYLKVTQRLTVVVYTVASDSDAGVVFETMNNRGKDLTELEKVKNYLLYLSGKLNLPAEHGLADEINDTWTHVFEHLMAADLGDVRNEDRLLRAHWLMAYDYDRRKWEGIRSIKERFNLQRYQVRHRDLLEDLSAYLTSLRNATIAYCDVYNPTHPAAFNAFDHDPQSLNSVVRASERFARLDTMATFLPFLLAVRLKGSQDGRVYERAVGLCEKFVFRVYRWMGKRSNTGRSRVLRIAHRLYHGQSVGRALDDLREAILYYCPDSRFEARFEQDEVNWYRWWGLKYFLYEYETHLAEQAGQPVRMPWEELTRKKDTVEHILPQTMASGGYWAERFTPEEHAKYVHDIGNLTLTYDNPTLSNKSFPRKKGKPAQPGTYAGSKLFIEQALATYDGWTAIHIEERRERIKQWAVERWHVEPPEPSTPETQMVDLSNVEAIQHVLTRRFIPYGQMTLYHALYKAGERGLTKSKLAEQIREGDRKSLTGVFGALGRRINSSEPFKAQSPGIGLFFEISRRGDDWHYCMRPELQEAIEGVPGLYEAVTRSLDEILDKYQQVWWSDHAAQRAQIEKPR